MKPNFDKLREIGKELEQLLEDGTFDEAAYERLLKEATEAADGNDDLIEFLVNEGELLARSKRDPNDD